MARKKIAAKKKPRIVSAVMTAAVAGSNDPSAAARVERVEKAMSDAVTIAMSEGVSIENSKEIRRRVIEARNRAMQE